MTDKATFSILVVEDDPLLHIGRDLVDEPARVPDALGRDQRALGVEPGEDVLEALALLADAILFRDHQIKLCFDVGDQFNNSERVEDTGFEERTVQRYLERRVDHGSTPHIRHNPVHGLFGGISHELNRFPRDKQNTRRPSD